MYLSLNTAFVISTIMIMERKNFPIGKYSQNSDIQSFFRSNFEFFFIVLAIVGSLLLHSGSNKLFSFTQIKTDNLLCILGKHFPIGNSSIIFSTFVSIHVQFLPLITITNICTKKDYSIQFFSQIAWL